MRRQLKLAGAVTVICPVPLVKLSTFIRWLWLNEWVTAERGIQVTFAIVDALVVFTVNTCAYFTAVGALEMTGRAAAVPSDLDGYGGE